METIRELYRIGHGPSSSHTMGPRAAVGMFLARVPEAPEYRVTLFGSLAATGKGHLTDATVKEGFGPRRLEIVWRPDEFLPFHPNALRFEALDAAGIVTASWTAYSVGGGKIVDGTPATVPVSIYPFSFMDEIVRFCQDNGRSLWEIVADAEGPEIWEYLAEVWKAMAGSVRRGLKAEGRLPGGLNLARKARSYHIKSGMFGRTSKRTARLFAYALAVSEENAGGGLIVTAPTCGSAGVVPAVLYHLQKEHRFSEDDILKALAAAGLIGNLAKANASISGAEVGCQGEIGAASCMAAALLAYASGLPIWAVETAAEIALEHHLGLTCDPVGGFVQIPCIERNAMGAVKAYNAFLIASVEDQGLNLMGLDGVIRAMLETGRDMSAKYKETATGGLALSCPAC